MKSAEAIAELACRGLALIAGVCVVLMMVHVVADVAAKYVFNMPIQGTLEIVSKYYMVAIVFLPLAIVELRKEHIYVDVFLRLMPDAVRLGVYFFTALLTASFYGVLAYQSYQAAMHAFRINEMMMGALFVVTWPGRWCLPLGFAAVALAVLLNVVKAVLQRRSSSQNEQTA